MPRRTARRWTGPLTEHPQGSALARGLLRLVGWRLLFNGLPGRQGVILVYPHTSNWDFPLGVFTKWALGLQVRFWAKDSLFAVPGFGAWLRWLGGVAVNRRVATGLVGQTLVHMREAQARDQLFWLVAAPEGTRAYVEGWKSGAYQVAVQAQVPVGVVYFDYATRTVGVTNFIHVSGDTAQDFALFAELLEGRKGKRPDQASPIRPKP